MVDHDRYESIKNVFKRDANTHKIIYGKFSISDFEYLKDCQWDWTEKIDGMNIRVILTNSADFRGRSDAAILPKNLLKRLRNTFDREEILEQTNEYRDDLCLYGEGAGAGIQKGDKYSSEQFFTMFDAMTVYGWASRRNMLAIAERLGILTAPEVFTGTIAEAVEIVKFGLVSHYGHFFAEGLVGRPTSELANQWGDRIITKIKHRDFYEV